MNTSRFFSILAAIGLLAATDAIAADWTFKAHLSGRNEVPPVDTRAQGQANFRLSADGMSLFYQLEVANIEDVIMAHIHVGPPDENGSIVVWLYPSAPPPVQIPGRFQGVLAAGVITEANLVGPLAGQVLEDLLAVLSSGGAYVNVHTISFPGGEIRGQID